MKNYLLLAIALLSCLHIQAQVLVPYLKLNGKFIFADSATMKPVIEREFDEAFIFSEGFARVQVNKKYGYIDKTGKELAPFKYEEGYDFENGLAQVMLDNKTSFIDKTGKEILPYKYNSLGDFSNGIAIASLNEKFGYIDLTGKEIIPLIYDGILDFTDGLARVELNGKYGFINKTGNIIIPVKYDDAMDFSKGMAVVSLNKKYGFIDKKGKLVIPLKYHHASTSFGEHLMVTVDSGSVGFRRGYIDRTGKVVIPWKFLDIRELSSGIYLAKSGNKIQLINTKLAKLAEWDIYEEWGKISDGIAFLRLKKGLPDGGKYVMIDNKGKEITTTKFDAGGDFINGIAAVKIAGKWGFIDKTGKQIIACKYDDLHIFSHGISRVKQNNQWFYTDKAGREFREQAKPLAAGWLFFDEFDDNRNGWNIDTTNKDFQTKFSTGDYYIWNKRDDQSRFLLRKIPDWNEKNNFRIEITMHYLPGGPDNMGNGLIIGCDEKISNYYRIIFNRNGQYRVDQSVIGKLVPLQDWKESSDILKWGDNKVGFTHINGIWTFYINEKKVYEMKAKEFFGKEIGMFIGPGSGYYVRTFKVYDWTKAATELNTPKEPLYEAQVLDYFKNNKYEWDLTDNNNVTASITGEAFRIKNKFTGYYMPSLVFDEKDMQAHRAELDARHTDGIDDYGFGLAFGKKDVNNSYVFYISANGYFVIGKFVNGSWSVLKDWTETDAVLKGNYVTNRLRFENDKGKWNFYINDKLVYSTYAITLPGKLFGCIVENKQTVEFTKFKFSRIIYP